MRGKRIPKKWIFEKPTGWLKKHLRQWTRRTVKATVKEERENATNQKSKAMGS